MIDPNSVLAAIAIRLGVSGAQAIGKMLLPRAAEPLREAALAAYGAAAAKVLTQHGEHYGTASTSFLAAQANLDRVLTSAWSASDPLRPNLLDGNGFEGAPEAPLKVLEEFVEAFRSEMRASPLLADVLARQELAARAEAHWAALQTEIGQIRSDLAPRPPIGTVMNAAERARWFRYLRTVADRYPDAEEMVTLDVLDASVASASKGSGELRRPLDDVVNEPAILVTGPPGSGKSSAIARIVRRAAIDAAAGPLASGGFVSGQLPIPVVVTPGPGSLFDRIAHALHSGGLGGRPLSSDWVREALAANILWVIVDDAHRFASPDALGDLLDYRETTRILIAGRETPGTTRIDLPRHRLAPLSTDQIGAVLRCHLREPDRAWSVARNARAHDETRALAERPQTLALLADAVEDEGWKLVRDKRELFRRAFIRRVEDGPLHHNALDDPEIVGRILGSIALAALRQPVHPYIVPAPLMRSALATVVQELSHQGDPFTVRDALAWLRERHFLVEAEGDRTGGLRFEHDQWHEFFASAELLRTGGLLGFIPSTDARREVALFLSTAADAASVIEHRPFWDAYWNHLANENPLFAIRCLRGRWDRYRPGGRHETMAEVNRVESQYPPLSSEEQFVDYEQYFTVYRDALMRHFTQLKPALDPKTDGRIGFRIGDGGTPHPFSDTVFHAFVGLDDEAPKIAEAYGLYFGYREPGVEVVGALHGYSSFPSRAFCPASLALRHLARQLEQAWNKETFWEPDALILERAYAEGAALYSAQNDRSGLAPLVLDVPDLIQELKQAPRSSRRAGVRYVLDTAISDRRVTLDGWQNTLEALDKRGLLSDALSSPVPSPSHLVARVGEGVLSEGETEALREWSVSYYPLLYETIWAFLQGNFPTTADEIPFTRQFFPASVILQPHQTAPQRPRHEYATLHLGSRWWGRSEDTEAPPAQVRYVPTREEAMRVANEVGTGWCIGSWHVYVRPDWMPLRYGVYNLLRRDIEASLRT